MEKETFFKYIHEKSEISATEFQAFAHYFEPVAVKKKTNLIIEGMGNDKIYFVEKGLLYAYKTREDGNIQVIQFAKENHWISDLVSFFTHSKALFAIQTLEDCQLVSITKSHFDLICALYPKMETFFRLMFQNAYVHTLQRLSDVYTEDAETKYNHFVNHQQAIVQRVPQYLIASYLGMLPSSLSRIRNKKQKK